MGLVGDGSSTGFGRLPSAVPLSNEVASYTRTPVDKPVSRHPERDAARREAIAAKTAALARATRPVSDTVAKPVHRLAASTIRSTIPALAAPRGIGGVRTNPGDVARSTPSHQRVVRTGGMKIDSDGDPHGSRKIDPNYRRDTSMTMDGKYVNAATIPYMVMPLNKMPHGVRLGDIAEVSYNGRKAYAIIADRGGHDTRGYTHGEGSVALARMLGIDANPATGGTDSGVTYTIIPGSGRRAGIYNGGPAVTNEQIQRAGAAAFNPPIPKNTGETAIV